MNDITFESLQPIGFIHNWSLLSGAWSARHALDDGYTWLTISHDGNLFIEREFDDPVWIGKVKKHADVVELIRILKSGISDAA